jgi:hypothetical protein
MFETFRADNGTPYRAGTAEELARFANGPSKPEPEVETPKQAYFRGFGGQPFPTAFVSSYGENGEITGPGTLADYQPPRLPVHLRADEFLDNPGDPSSEDQGDDDWHRGHDEAMAGLRDHERRAGPEVGDDDDDDDGEPCQACDGSGIFQLEDEAGNVTSQECEECDGTGFEMGPEFTPAEMADEVAAMSSTDRDDFLRALAPTFGLDPEMIVALARSASEDAERSATAEATGQES